jgi:phosphate-selective porin OprO/OprP
MRLRRCLGFVAMLGLMAATTQIVKAQQTYAGDSNAELLGRLSAAEQRMAELESQLSQRQQPFQMQNVSWNYDSMARRLEVLEAAVAYGDDKDGAGGDGWVDSHAQKWSAKWGGRIMFDYVNFAQANGDSVTVAGADPQDYGEFRRIRLFTSGKGYGVYEYKFQVDFEPEQGTIDDPAVSIKDMYVAINDIPVLGKVKMGHFKEPFSLEELTSSKYITFMERSLPNAYARARNVGISATRHSDCPKWWIGYGAFFNDISDTAKERVDDNQGVDLAARGVWLPMYANDGRQLLHIGGGLVYVDDRNDEVRFRARPEVHEGPRWVDSGTLVADDYATANLEAALVMGPFSVQAELFATRIDDVGQDFYGGYVYGSYFLTGENRAYKVSSAAFDRVKPLENFWIVNTPEGRCVGTGAWELAFRYSFLDITGTADAESGVQNDITLGVNWYWNPYTRMMFNYIHAANTYSNNALNSDTDILALRWQVDF